MGNLEKFSEMMSEAEGKKPSELSWRQDKLNDTFKGITVDTCNSPDCGWETGIEVNDESWVIVEEYPDKESAGKGHAKWVKKLKKNPKLKLENCRTAEDWICG